MPCSVRDRSAFESYSARPYEIRAASYAVLVISEAEHRIPEAWLADYPEIPWHAIRTIGNKLRHEYHRISETILWGIVATHSDELTTASRRCWPSTADGLRQASWRGVRPRPGAGHPPALTE